jgi:hypothetical protein
LVAYTINPYLVIFDLKGLAPLTYLANLINHPQNSSLNTKIYNEIPIGTMTENLIARSTDCYAFDEYGDPIDGEKIKTDNGKEIPGPTYLEHDRVDCFIELSKAAEKKAQTIEDLSNEIIRLMQKCSCGLNSSSSSSSSSSGFLNKTQDIFLALLSAKNSSSKDGFCINDKCAEDSSDCQYTQNDFGGDCNDSCFDKSCKCDGESCDQCPEGVKDKIDAGDLCLAYACDSESGETMITSDKDECDDNEKTIKGLNEFKSDYNSDYQTIKQKVEIQPPPKLNDKTLPVIDSGGCELCEDRGDKDCLIKRKKCLLKNSPWYKLKLIDQLIYLKGKIEEIKTSVEADKKNLEKGEDELGKCYLADSYVDFVKTYEATRKEETTILINQNYTDQGTGKLINPAKYCAGYEYNNSTCYSECKDICPGNQQKDFECYKEIKDCSGKMAAAEKENCLAEQESKYLDCFATRSCIQNASPFSSFEECHQNCEDNCLKDCEAKFCTDGEEKKACQKKCYGDSQCLIDNMDKCLINTEKLRQCLYTNDNLEDWQKCMKDAERCPSCSDQYAGYADCLKSSYSSQGNYSASYIFKMKAQNNDVQICSPPNKSITSNTGTTTTCITLYPETSKCPASSKCPDCPCDNNTTSETTDAQVCSGNCNIKSFNDDPLTFYCNQSWWTKDAAKKENPVGEERICPLKKEIPVGQTVDEAEAWAQTFIKKTEEVSKKIKDLTDYMEKIVKEKEKGYCECESKCDDAGKEPICKVECIPNEEDKVCQRSGCLGNPCQKILNMLKGKKASDGCPKGVEYKGIKYYHDQIKNTLANLLTLVSSRSDILKRLEYSRNMTDSCSTTQNNYGDYVQLLSCTRAEDEIVYPIVDKNANKTILNGKATPAYCYGKELGKISGGATLMDNWFCCELREIDKTK